MKKNNAKWFNSRHINPDTLDYFRTDCPEMKEFIKNDCEGYKVYHSPDKLYSNVHIYERPFSNISVFSYIYRRFFGSRGIVKFK